MVDTDQEALDPDSLYHLATSHEWVDYQAAEVMAPPSLAAEGFVHCSWGRQVRSTVARHFSGVTDVLALEIDPTALGDLPLVEEDSYASGQSFPHVYGQIPVSAVIRVVSID